MENLIFSKEDIKFIKELSHINLNKYNIEFCKKNNIVLTKRIHSELINADIQNMQCEHSILFADIDENIKTILGLLKQGDSITLKWYYNNNNGFLDNSLYNNTFKLYQDDLYLIINRATKNINKKLTFLICSTITPDNSVKMIREEV